MDIMTKDQNCQYKFSLEEQMNAFFKEETVPGYRPATQEEERAYLAHASQDIIGATLVDSVAKENKDTNYLAMMAQTLESRGVDKEFTSPADNMSIEDYEEMR